MTPRLAKQLLYGAGYLIAVFLISFGVYYIWFRPAPSCFDNRRNQGEVEVDCGGPCQSCEIKRLSPLKITWIKSFPAEQAQGGTSQTIIAAEIQNPNPDWGAEKMSYAINIYDVNGAVISTVNGNSLIYPGEIKYIVELTNINQGAASQPKIDFSNIDWQSKDNFPQPQIQTRSIETRPRAEGAGPTVVGYATNNNAFVLSKMRLIAILYNQVGDPVAASKTEINDVGAFEEKQFQINFPNDVSVLNTSISTIFVFSKNLSLESMGKDVTKLQEFLVSKGYLAAKPTGHFGKATSKALIQYQSANGIAPQNGSLGPKTRDKINAELKNQASLVSLANLKASDPSRTKIYVEAIR